MSGLRRSTVAAGLAVADALAFAPLIVRAMEEIPEDVVIVSGLESGDVVALGEMREAMSHGRPCRAVIKNYKKDGSTFWNEIAPISGCLQECLS